MTLIGRISAHDGIDLSPTYSIGNKVLKKIEEQIMELRGGCLCGDVRYEFSGEPYRKFVCHCRDCQRSGGSLFHAGVAVPRAGFRLTKGTLSTYESMADSGRRIQRKFCPRCGAGIVNEPSVWPDHVVIRIGTLDDPSLISPSTEFYSASRAPWITIRTS